MKAFTLIELLVSVAILAIMLVMLAGVFDVFQKIHGADDVE